MNKKVITTIATGVAVAGVLTFLFKTEKGCDLRKKFMNRVKKAKDAEASY